MKNVPPADRVKRVREVADMVRIGHLLEKMPSQCSGGESQRVALARTLVTNPSTFSPGRAAVEPGRQVAARAARGMRPAAPDAQTYVHLRDARPRGSDDAGRPHRRHALGRDRADRFANGDLLQPVNHFFVADSFGSPSMNLVAGEVVQDGAGCRFRSSFVNVALPERFKALKPGAATLGIRPEHVAAHIGAKGDVELPVRLVEPLGQGYPALFRHRRRAGLRRGHRRARMAEITVGEHVSTHLGPAPYPSLRCRWAAGRPLFECAGRS